MRPAAAAALAVALLAGCRGEPELNEAEKARVIEAMAEAKPKPPPDHRPVLQPLTAADLQRELRPGGGCHFSAGGQLLFVAVAGDAVARVNGRIVHFAPAGPVGPSGGFFTSGPYSVSAGRTRTEDSGDEEAASWPGRLSVADRSRDEPA
ncbi:MAG: hypothetical protein M3N07_05660, partial [Pseudomonadota bacterium]|nr:hypothetical protein [Pseudomonadota bacterium]